MPSPAECTTKITVARNKNVIKIFSSRAPPATEAREYKRRKLLAFTVAAAKLHYYYDENEENIRVQVCLANRQPNKNIFPCFFFEAKIQSDLEESYIIDDEPIASEHGTYIYFIMQTKAKKAIFSDDENIT